LANQWNAWPATDGVDLGVRHRERFRLAGADVGGRGGALERSAHPRDGFDRDYPESALEQGTR
jgi:hypothetical protein